MTGQDVHFDHRPSAHCETGVISNLLRHNGLEISEPMIFGLAGAMNFAFLRAIKINGMPLIAYRLPPKMIFRLLSWRVPGLRFRFETFRNEQAGMQELDRQLADGKVVGLQTSVFFLPYFPEAMRFHFNAHNLIVYNRKNGDYQISDPLFSHLVTSPVDSIRKARFAKGVLAPKGSMYYPVSVPESIDYEVVIPKAVRFMARLNGPRNPVPVAGVAGIRRMARYIRRLGARDDRYARLFMAHIVRMQEEIGTGGAGFRYIYAAFLQESGNLLNSDALKEYSNELTLIGDQWREFAAICARLSKHRGDQSFEDAAVKLLAIADAEYGFHKRLGRFRLR